MTYTTRRAGLADLEQLTAFTLAEAAEAEGMPKHQPDVRAGIRTALLDDDVAMYWLLEHAGVAIGHASIVKEWSDWHAGYYWWIQSMYLDPQHRGRGLMPRLLGAIRECAREHHALQLRLYVHRENSRAIRAYQLAGFNDSDYRIMVMDVAGD